MATKIKQVANISKLFADHFEAGTEEGVDWYTDQMEAVNVPEDKPTAREIVSALHGVGNALHGKMVDLIKDRATITGNTPEQYGEVTNEVIKNFKEISSVRLDYRHGDGDPHVHFSVDEVAAGRVKVECCVHEADMVILHSAVNYGVLSGVARAAAEHLKDL